MKQLNKNQRGFTIIELLIAIGVFSVVLMLCSTAIVHVGRMYYKGVITNRTQDTARRFAEDVAGAIQFGTASSDPLLFRRTGTASFGITVESLCLGDVRYSYSRSHYLGEIPHVVWRDRWSGSTCPPVNITVAVPSAGGQEMLGANMRVPQGINVPLPSGGLWQVSVFISYGDTTNLFTDSTLTSCRGVNASGQFCATSGFNTSVVKRL